MISNHLVDGDWLRCRGKKDQGKRLVGLARKIEEWMLYENLSSYPTTDASTIELFGNDFSVFLSPHINNNAPFA